MPPTKCRRRRHRRNIRDAGQLGGVALQIDRCQPGMSGITAMTAVSTSCPRSRCATGRRPDAPTPTSAAPGHREAPLHPEEGCAEDQQQRDNGQAERKGPAHNGCRRAVPELLLDRTVGRGRGGPAAAAPSRRTSRASSRSPSSTIAAGVTTTAASAANATVATPA